MTMKTKITHPQPPSSPSPSPSPSSSSTDEDSVCWSKLPKCAVSNNIPPELLLNNSFDSTQFPLKDFVDDDCWDSIPCLITDLEDYNEELYVGREKPKGNKRRISLLSQTTAMMGMNSFRRPKPKKNSTKGGSNISISSSSKVKGRKKRKGKSIALLLLNATNMA